MCLFLQVCLSCLMCLCVCVCVCGCKEPNKHPVIPFILNRGLDQQLYSDGGEGWRGGGDCTHRNTVYRPYRRKSTPLLLGGSTSPRSQVTILSRLFSNFWKCISDRLNKREGPLTLAYRPSFLALLLQLSSFGPPTLALQRQKNINNKNHKNIFNKCSYRSMEVKLKDIMTDTHFISLHREVRHPITKIISLIA